VTDYSEVIKAHRRDHLARPMSLPTGVHRHFESTTLPLPIEKVFEFFSKAENLEAITPPELQFKILTPLPIIMERGALIDYKIKMSGIPFGWRTRITHWDPPYAFADQQLKGPYAVWFHTHTFADEGGKTRMDDEVLYKLPLWPLGEIAYPFVRGKVEGIFKYRRQKIRKLLGV
jgi:ligand-binding SRPBCC domain-containing protein